MGVTRRGGVDHVSKIPKYQQEDVTDASSLTHCSKSSFFVQKFNFDFPKKLLIFLGEKLVKMLWLSTVKLLTTLISREKLSRKFCVKNLWKYCGFGLFSCWQFWLHEKNYKKKFGWKTREIEFLDKNLTFQIVCLGNFRSKSVFGALKLTYLIYFRI